MTRACMVLMVGLLGFHSPVALSQSSLSHSDNANEDRLLRSHVQRYWVAWATGDPNQAAPLYAKDAGLVFYDLEPLKWIGWADYRVGVVPHVLSKFESIRFHVNDDLDVTRRGSVAWTTATIRAGGVLRASGSIEVMLRHTAIWERRDHVWLIVHDHVSVPSRLPAAPAR